MHAQRLREAAMRRTLDVLSEYRLLCLEHRVQAIAAVGTAALRNAANRQEFVERAGAVGIDVRVISGEEEARLSFQAVRLDPLWRHVERLLVVDIGGGSTEVIRGRARPDTRVSLPIGAVSLTEGILLADPPTIRQMDEAGAATRLALSGQAPSPGTWGAVGVGGTLVNMAAVKLHLPAHDPERLHGTILSVADVELQVELYGGRTVEERKQIVGLEPARADVILGGALVLLQVLCTLEFPGIAVSCRGLRWGVLYEAFGQ
jgi:exopolyphosphatase/guanosine-5'-triphosphate,3'-diphosphate pyrophosphatase